MGVNSTFRWLSWGGGKQSSQQAAFDPCLGTFVYISNSDLLYLVSSKGGALCVAFKPTWLGYVSIFYLLVLDLSFFPYPFFNKCYQLLTSLPESEYQFGLIGGLKDTVLLYFDQLLSQMKKKKRREIKIERSRRPLILTSMTIMVIVGLALPIPSSFPLRC